LKKSVKTWLLETQQQHPSSPNFDSFTPQILIIYYHHLIITIIIIKKDFVWKRSMSDRSSLLLPSLAFVSFGVAFSWICKSWRGSCSGARKALERNIVSKLGVIPHVRQRILLPRKL
jgi:hypothetical protein